jgi:hypothetical protein
MKNPVVEKYSTDHYKWKCPKCGKMSSKQFDQPTDEELTCYICKKRERTTFQQKRIEDLVLCSKVVKVDVVEIDSLISASEQDEGYNKIRSIKLLCSDDNTFITIRVCDNRDEEDCYDRVYMTFETEKVKNKKR